MKELKISAIKDGTVIDHLPPKYALQIAKILQLENLDSVISVATNLQSKKQEKKGIIKIGDKFLTEKEVNKIALIAPYATLNIIKGYKVIEKKKIKIPELIKDIVKCFNPNCITDAEKVKTKFYVVSTSPLKLKCNYCERGMGSENITLL